ncbi:ABC transporter permease [Haloflavibacter putidus]|uniref:ABC transporter permease n=1 Tax=Haloflavibacter putidus TaxID=2576776 RepID=A0A507ZTQ0_9FLAO|nr:ABC transporter permease [Haloflavibacter putidus]TQD39634.1 ABC transporter permease [Haloflavibacter putidus]
MFNIERWQEIFETIGKNKLRTFLTGISVASGIFILVTLLGVGEGMQNGIQTQFQSDATNRISVWTGLTSVEYNGLNPGRRIQLKNKDFFFTEKKFSDNLEYRSPLFRVWGQLISYKKESGSYRIEGVFPDYQFLESQSMLAGRFLNYTDQENYEKIMVIGQKVKNDLFKNNETALGKLVQVSGINFKVVGVFQDPGGEREEARVFIPLSTAQRVFSGGNDLRGLAFTLPQEASFDVALAASENFIKQLEKQLKKEHTVAPNDDSAIRINNSLEEAKRFYDLIGMIKAFFWGVGIATIFAGIVGVSNIMLIIVKERTKEIGIRKALGAEPLSIIGMILHEAIFVTAIAGFIGLFFGLLLLEFVGPMVQTDFITNPTVNFNVALTTVVILIIAGAVAGFFPARKAALIKPIVALRDE